MDEALTGLIEEAAALWENLAQNHPFIDGNIRTAFAATYTFKNRVFPTTQFNLCARSRSVHPIH